MPATTYLAGDAPPVVDNEKRLETIAKADLTAGFLHEAAWDDVLKPALMKERNNLTTLLVSTVLGKPNPDAPTREQLAGLIYGIDRTIKIFEDVIKKGQVALEQLESQGFHLTSNNL